MRSGPYNDGMTGEAVVVIVVGLAVGSFLNVCIHRLPRGSSVIWGRSRCPHCGSPIRPLENIPLVSFLVLRARCRRCGHRIGWIYPVVELMTAALFYVLYLKYGMSTPFWINGGFFALLVVLTFIDLFERILPDVLTLGGLVMGILLSPFQSSEFFAGDPFLPEKSSSLWMDYAHSLLGAVLGAGLVGVVAFGYWVLRKTEGMGHGDIKMMAMIGAFVGWRYAWLTVFLGSLAGAVMGSLYILLQKKGTRYELPFGSFIAFGAVIATLYGLRLVSWYATFL
ncbi:MAG: prepilin peptidase [Acidobacteria bacterium]|nr:prepilin peptidase [Acidobacteriota bacterium]